jgi:sodium-coupled neutral amino acid transporter 11
MLERNLIVIATSLMVMVPLSMQRDMASLSFTSALSVFADSILVVFIAMFAPVKESVAAQGGFLEVLKQDGIQSTLFIGLGILSTAMACQHSAFIVANSLENKTRNRWRIVTNQSIGMSTILCAILGVCGYLGFLGLTQGDVLNNFPLDSTQADAARMLLAFTMYVTYPMESFVARHVLIMLVHNGDMDARGGFTLENESQVEEIELAERRPQEGDAETVNSTNTNQTTGSVIIEGGGILCMNRRQSWTLTVYLMTLIPALIFSDIGPVLSLTGAVGGSCISYIGPGLCFLGLNGDAFLAKVNDWVSNWRIKRGYNKGESSGVTDSSELPVEGNASLEIPQNPSINSYTNVTSGPKPCLYYMGLFPFWCSVANIGAQHTQKKIDASGLAADANVNADESSDVLPSPTNWDFFVSFFFVLFGFVAAVAGVFSNVYVQMKNLDQVEP